MIRILHFADLHLGVETYGKIDPHTGLSTRLADFLRALDELVDYALAERVDLVLFCGDAYKSREPSQTHQREFARRIRRLIDAGIPVFLLVGNHDLPAAVSRATSLEIYGTLLSQRENSEPGTQNPGLGGVYVAGKPGTHVVATAAGPVQIVALPWVTPGRFLVREDPSTGSGQGPSTGSGQALTIDQTLERMEEAVGRFVEEQGEALDPGLPSVLAAHAALTGSLVREGSEKWMTVGRYPELLKSTLHPHLFDYVALGHMHQRQVLDGATPMVYPGSLARVDFGEEEGEKGFYVVELDPTKPRGKRLASEPEFRPVRTRPFVTVSVRPRGEDPTPEVLAAIEKANVGEAIVRVIIHLSRAQEALLRESEVRQALSAAHFLAYVKREIIEEPRTTRLPAGVRPESLTPIEALSLYLDDRKVAQDRREVLLRHARALLEGPE